MVVRNQTARVILPLVYELRARDVPVGTGEVICLAQALAAELHQHSLNDFYYVARATLVHSEVYLDAFDEAFLTVFRGVERTRRQLLEAVKSWLSDLEQDSEWSALRDRFLEDPGGRPDAGSEPGRGRAASTGDQIGRTQGAAGRIASGRQGVGSGGQRSALRTADARAYRGYREDLTLDVRQMSVALRRLRSLKREGHETELDLDTTIDATARNAGELEVVMRPPRRPSPRVILAMDVGGSMDPYAHLVSRLFSAARKATHFRELRTYYFHNCIYGVLYRTDRLDDGLTVPDLLRECHRRYKLILVGDALMAPYELLHGGAETEPEGRVAGLTWFKVLARHFDRSVWLNPEPESYWRGNTIEYVQEVFDMFPLTLHGLSAAVDHLRRGRTRPRDRG